MSLSKINPVTIIRDTYNSPEAIARRKERIREKYKNKIQALKDGTKSRIKGILKGHFRGPGSEDAQKIVFFLLLVVTAVLGPFGLGYIGLEKSTQMFIFSVVYLLVLLLFERLRFINFKNFTGIIIFILFNALINPLLNSNFVAGFIGANSDAVFKIVLLLFMFLFTLHFGGVLSGKAIGIFAVIVLLFLSIPYMIGTLQNKDRLEAQQDRLQTEAQIAVEKADLIDRIMAWVEDSMNAGKGENINTATQEQTAEYIGVKISDVRSLKQTYQEGEQVTLLIDFEGKVFQPTTLRTQCMADKYMGKTNPESFDMQKPIMGSDELLPTLYPRVECAFDKLPRGAYKIVILSYYRHNSSVILPLRIMSYEQSNVLYQNFVDTGKYSSIKEYIGGEPKIISSSGPVIINPANDKNAERQWVYIDPLIVNKNTLPESPLTYLTFQLKQSPEDLEGEIQSIRELTFSMPEGLDIACSGINKGEKIPTKEVDGRWLANAKSSDFNIELKELIDCQVFTKEGYVDKFVPSNAWSSESIILNVMYDYEQRHIYQDVVEVI